MDGHNHDRPHAPEMGPPSEDRRLTRQELESSIEVAESRDVTVARAVELGQGQRRAGPEAFDAVRQDNLRQHLAELGNDMVFFYQQGRPELGPEEYRRRYRGRRLPTVSLIYQPFLAAVLGLDSPDALRLEELAEMVQQAPQREGHIGRLMGDIGGLPRWSDLVDVAEAIRPTLGEQHEGLINRAGMLLQRGEHVPGEVQNQLVALLLGNDGAAQLQRLADAMAMYAADAEAGAAFQLDDGGQGEGWPMRLVNVENLDQSLDVLPDDPEIIEDVDTVEDLEYMPRDDSGRRPDVPEHDAVIYARTDTPGEQVPLGPAAAEVGGGESAAERQQMLAAEVAALADGLQQVMARQGDAGGVEQALHDVNLRIAS